MHGCSRQKVKQVKTFHGIGNGLKCFALNVFDRHITGNIFKKIKCLGKY